MTRSHSPTPTPSPGGGRRRRKRARIACRECRQAKIRCGLESVVPCPRCRKMGLDCTVDASYRRANRHDKVRELQNQLEELQNSIHVQRQQPDALPLPLPPPVPEQRQQGRRPLEHGHEPGGQAVTAPVDHQTHATESPTTLSITPARQAAPIASGPISHGHAGDHHAFSSTTAPETPDGGSSITTSSVVCVLETTRLTRNQVKAMFTTYFEHYHIFLPILDPQRTNETCYETSPLLFWSIIAVAARQLQLEDGFLTQLGGALSRLLWATVASNTSSTHHVQAMLLLACWPLPDVHLWTDKSLTLSRMAVNAAMMMGMHRPGSEHEYTKIQVHPPNQWEILERSRTWTASAALCQSLSLELGHGSVSHFDDWSIRSACGFESSFAADLPVQIRHSLMIQRCSHEALRSLSQAAEGPYGIPAGPNCFDLIAHCEQEFQDLYASLDDQLSLASLLELHGSRLHIQCFYFLYDDQVELRLPGILRAYTTASTLISTILSDDQSYRVLPHAPLRFTRIIFTAALVIFRVLHSTFAMGLDYGHGQLLFNAAAFAMQQFSVRQKDKDLPLRASDMLRAFWRAGERSATMRNQNLKLRVKTRMGASLVYDCLMFLRRHKHRAPVPVPLQDSTANNGSRLMPANLDLTAATSPSDNLYTKHIEGPDLAPSISGSIFSDELLHISPNIDMSDMFWFEDMGYPGFFGID